jgi:hypothetical protein
VGWTGRQDGRTAGGDTRWQGAGGKDEGTGAERGRGPRAAQASAGAWEGVRLRPRGQSQAKAQTVGSPGGARASAQPATSRSTSVRPWLFANERVGAQGRAASR